MYIMASAPYGALYTGVTSNLAQRVRQHKDGVLSGFTSRYSCKQLVWYEHYDHMVDAIAREKQIKAGSRAKKVALVQSVNPKWSDLYDRLAL
ncbi:MAG TPA: GIY-YIG nuclease family protein [Roseiarcus sp.]|nr:GIY-YIG nuclease family protein [Roseiarcus sp.]